MKEISWLVAGVAVALACAVVVAYADRTSVDPPECTTTAPAECVPGTVEGNGYACRCVLPSGARVEWGWT